MPYLINLFYDTTCKIYPLFIQSQQFFNHRDQLVRTSVRTIALTLLSMDDKDHLFEYMPQSQFFINVALNLRDMWLKIDNLSAKDPVNNDLTRLIEDGNEYLFFIQDLYDVIVQYEPYHRMMTSALLKVFYVPVVLQSLCVMEIKPKLQIHTSIYLLTQSLLVFKDQVLQENLITLTMGVQMSKELSLYLKTKDLYSTSLYSDVFKHVQPSKYSLV